MYQNIPTKVLTNEARLSYANLTTPRAPRAPQQGGDPKYSVTLLIPKSDTATYQDILTSRTRWIPTPVSAAILAASPRRSLPVLLRFAAASAALTVATAVSR